MTKFSIAMCAGALALALTAGHAAAQVDDQTKQTCAQLDTANADTGIAACTAIIEADQSTDAYTRSRDYANRALQYENASRDSEALADFRTAAQINPGNLTALAGIDELSP